MRVREEEEEVALAAYSGGNPTPDADRALFPAPMFAMLRESLECLL